eukprot:1222863-Rhodomonas_salina.1
MLWVLGPRVRGKTWGFRFGALGLEICVVALAETGFKGTLRSPSGSALHYCQRISLQTENVLNFPPGRGTAHVRADHRAAEVEGENYPDIQARNGIRGTQCTDKMGGRGAYFDLPLEQRPEVPSHMRRARSGLWLWRSSPGSSIA